VALACGAALAACATVPVDELLGSTAIVAELSYESGELIEAARFSEGRAGEALCEAHRGATVRHLAVCRVLLA